MAKNALKSWHREYEQRCNLSACNSRRAKYTKAQKERAVKHYLESGRCVAATIKALGYPSRGLLSAWVQEQCPGVRARFVGRSQEQSPAMKQSAVIALCMRQESAQAVAQEVGVSRPTLYKWKNQLLGYDTSALMTRHHDSSPSPERDELEKQVEALRRDIRRLQLEQDILKKANELLKNHRPWLRRLLSVEKHRRRVGIRQMRSGMDRHSKPTAQGASEYYWDLLMEPLQRER